MSPSRRHFLTLTAAVTAAACLPARRAQAQTVAPAYPLTGGEAWDVFKAYDPATNADAPFYRSRVRRAERIAPLAATQAHTGLDANVSSGTLVAAYLTLDSSDIDFNRTRYATATQNRVHVERAWQYQDIVVGWNTTGLVPNPALTDAAHRNGARCLGTMFQPDKRFFDGSDLPRPDVARKLVALCAYFGFNGYFVNFESFTEQDASAVQDLIALMQAEAARTGLHDFHIQYYNGYTDARAVWPGSAHVDGSPREATALRANSMMIDQGWSNYGLTHGCCSGPALPALPAPVDLGGNYDPMAVFYGLQLYPGPGYLGLIAPTVIAPNGGGKAKGGLQIYSAEDGLRKMRRARLDRLRAKPVLTAAEKRELADWTDPATSRNAWYRLHDRFWSGQSGNPARKNAPSAAQAAIYGPANIHKIYTDYEAPGHATDQLRLPITYGVANFIAERSVIGSLPFVSSFNTGEGDRFFRDGVAVAAEPWFNLGAQDVLPTWTWWTKPLHGSLDRDHDRPGLLNVDYDFRDAWDGGASLIVSGPLKAANATEVRLYKTSLAVAADTQLSLTGKGGAHGKMSAGLIFADAPQTVVWLPVTPAAPDANGWWQWRAPLSAHAGRTVAAISLGFAPKASGTASYSVRVGRIALTGAQGEAPAQPTDFRISANQVAPGGSAALRLQWTFDPAVSHYDILSGDGMHWLGRISSDAYVVPSLARPSGARQTALQLVATATDGRTSRPATCLFTWPD